MPLRGEFEPGRRMGALHQIFTTMGWAVACVTPAVTQSVPEATQNKQYPLGQWRPA